MIKNGGKSAEEQNAGSCCYGVLSLNPGHLRKLFYHVGSYGSLDNLQQQ